MINKYLDKIAKTTSQGDAREESYYGHFSNFLTEFANKLGKTNTQITILPKKTEGGNPDFRIWDGKQHIIGYIEAKKPGENLDVIESSEQLVRYRNTFPNLILTDFYQFRLYRNGILFDSTLLARPFIAKKLKTTPPPEREEKFISLMEKFFSFSLPKVFTAENLAIELAKRTGFLRDEVIEKELEEEAKGKGRIFGFYKAFNDYLVSNLTHKDFADIYSQTITYGLFAARTKANNDFTRKNAYDLIPPTIGILRDVFQFISLGTIPPHMEVMIDDIAEVLQAADVNKILQEFYRKGKGDDPIVHFYETFLNIYDPTTRERRGVYYTPVPVVKYIVNAVHAILKNNFKRFDGLANKGITLLDPAGGTLTFPAEAIKVAVSEYISKYGDGGKKKFIRDQILKNYYSFELMMAPYAIGHIKISFLLEELGYQLRNEDRFKLYLTNTLDMDDLEQTEIPGLGSLSEESHLASYIKQKENILVIIGNPPYSGISANINEWTEKLLKENLDGSPSYYEVDGKPLGERKLWLQDDYVKFIRFSQWKINKAGQGIIGMITNHSYLDNPTFRGMRQSLLSTFNEIYILDLHGSSLKKETNLDGSKDENVFDIRQGVAISIFIKYKDKKGCKVYHHDLYGLREQKYNWLEKTSFKTNTFKRIYPNSPWYFFIPKDTSGGDVYDKFPKINEIFPVNNVGIVTARDHFAISNQKNSLENRIRQFKDLKTEEEIIRLGFKLKDTSTFKLKKSRQEVAKLTEWEKLIIPINYRPFDKRFIFYTKWVVERPISDTMKHMIKIDNLAININRQVKTGTSWSHVFVSNGITEACYISNRTSEICYLHPLFTLPDNGEDGNGDLFNPPKNTPEANISIEIYENLVRTYGQKVKPRQIFNYVYAIFHSNLYRTKYFDFLKIDFPRVPFTKKYSLFDKIAKLGGELIELHLMNHKSLSNPISKFEGKGDNDVIEKYYYSSKEKRIYINENKYFSKVTDSIWSFTIGSYQILERYLKTHKGKEIEDPRNFTQIITVISKTLDLQKKIDAIYNEAEKNTISF